jgi:D-alanyl-D-alanine carboxypeptidase
VYKPPSDDEQYDDDDDERDGEDTQRISHTRPRRSSVPQRSAAKTRRDFYFDEHPEIPKVRRASLQKPRSGADFPNRTEHDEDLPERERTSVHRTPASLQKGWREKPAFTGLETDADEGSASPARPRRSGSFNQAASKVSLNTGEPRTPVYRVARPRPRSESTESFSLPASRTREPFWRQRKSLLIIGFLVLLVIVTAPLLANSIHNNTTAALSQKASAASTATAGSVSTSSPGTNDHVLVITPPDVNHPAPPVYATSAYLLDTGSGATLYAQNPYLHLPMLSTTKLMTVLLAVEQGNLNQKITITAAMEHDINQLSADSALFGVKQGQTYTLRDIIYGLLYLSGNDAALIIADDLAGSVTKFVAEMNKKAQALGLHDTHFVNPHGLLAAGQYSCAHDLALLGNDSLNNPIVQQISSGRVYHIAAGGNHPARVLLNENQFLWWFPGVNAGKTGYDGESDFIQVISVTRNHVHMIGVVMNTNNWWTDMRDLMDYGSNDYTWVSPRDVDNSGQPIPFDNLWNYFATDTQQITVPVGAQSNYYVLTGYNVSGPILSYFNHNGGLKKFGYPTAMPSSSGGEMMSQAFQHAKIECDFSNNSCRTL